MKGDVRFLYPKGGSMMIRLNYKFSYDVSEVNKCLLCYQPTCTSACPNQIPVGDILRSLYMDNWLGAAGRGYDRCMDCDAPCEKACLLSAGQVPVKIREIFRGFHENIEKNIPRIFPLTYNPLNLSSLLPIDN